MALNKGTESRAVDEVNDERRIFIDSTDVVIPAVVAIDDSGNQSGIGSNPLFTNNFLIEVRKGNIPGHSIVHKFGQATIGTTLSPITQSGVYMTPTTAQALEFVSDSANDTSAGSGAREITIEGLDANWAVVTQTLVTNGVTAVALTTDLVRLYRWYVSSSGTYAGFTGGSHDGTLTIRAASAGATWTMINTTVFAKGQSEIGAITIANAVTGYILHSKPTVDSKKLADIILFQRANADDVTIPYSGVMRVVDHSAGLIAPDPFYPPGLIGPFVGPCDLGYMAKVATGTGFVAINFGILLIDD